MLRLVCLAVLATCALGAVTRNCKVSEWSDWSECVVEKNCPGKVTSGPLTAPNDKLAESRRALNMARKEMERAKTAACREAGTCPELDFKKSSKARADCIGGVSDTPAGVLPCENIDMAAFISFDDLGSTEGGSGRAGNDDWGWTDSVDGHEYSIVGVSHGTSFVRTTDPVNPEVLCWLDTHTNPSSWRDMKVVNDHAYIVSEASDHGMQVFDLTRLRTMSQAEEGNVPDCAADAHYGGIGHSHNIASNPGRGFVYVVGAVRGTNSEYTLCAGGLHAVDVSDPKNPTLAACFGDDGYVHDVECLDYHGPDTPYQGHEICFGYNEDSLTIMDVEDKNNIVMISRSEYDTAKYTHQGWTLGSHTALLLDDELDEVGAAAGDKHTRTYFWDITDLDAPELKSVYYSEKQSIDHNLYIVQDYAYQSNYEAGLRILEIFEADHSLEQRAYFQMKETEPEAVYKGTWSNYPYFATNSEGYPNYISVTSIDWGFFTLEPRYENFSRNVEAHQTRTRESTCSSRLDVRTCSADPTC